MAFLENPRFPDDIAYGVSFGPEFSTSIATTVGGQEIRNRNRTRALCVGDCSHGLKTEAQFRVLLSFFRSVGGRFHGFRFKDWSDFTCDESDSFTQLTTGTSYQMFKVYESAVGFADVRKISKPIGSTIKVYRTRSSIKTELTAGTFAVDSTTGIITITSGHLAGDTYTWSGEFDVPCRFETDRLSASIAKFGAYEWTNIPIKEIPL